MPTTENLHEFIELTVRKRELKDQSKGVNERLAELEESLKGEFTSECIQKISSKGYTVYLNRQILPSVVSGMMPDLCVAMTDMGAGDLVKESVNAQSLGAWVRELDRDDDDMPTLPPPVAGLINVFEKFGLKARKD